ncbi:ABC transporter ATP-binding protein [Terrihabitans soli]|uniref:ABC transporter ATP-binding protein n=1 Tax=Terrihabitans soli TaxID=708113 RepID=A0A6S6QQM4_9HYPH|nr:ABC transporter ATP-binding protein [Terrihabitans soli]BCJ91856.1 ABC transporter ATP-binding protein [Terrihabitans soli]
MNAKAKDKPQRDSLKLIHRVLRENSRKYLPRYLLAFGMMAVVSGLTGASAWIMKSIFNDVLVARDATLILALALGVFIIYAGRGLADYGQTVVMNSVGRTMVSEQQQRILTHLLAQDMRFYNTASVGHVIVILTQGAESIRSIMNLILTSLGKDTLSLISLGTVMVLMDPILSAIAFVVTPAALLSLGSIKKRIRSLGKLEFQGVAHVFSGVKEAMIGIRVVKSFGLEPRILGELNGVIDRAAKQGMKIGNLSARSGPIMEALVGVAMAAIIMYAGYGIAGGARDAGSLLAFLAALLLTYAPAKNLARLHLSIETTLIGVEMFYAFIDSPAGLQDVPDAKPLAIGRGDVELRNVSFSYGDAAAALIDTSIHFPAGKMSALVGGSGAGKSTIFSLIERFYAPQSGSVVIDGQDISKVTTASLRDNIAFVTQDSFLFEGSIYDNIRSGRWEATEDDIIAAAKAANAHEFIIAHPEGYQRVAGEGGANLSGGQKQRIAIARAMLRNAPILLLDEATSALDAASEVKVRDALNELMKGRTTIVIAHRLSTVRQADIIHVMEAGRLIESGTHEQLVKQRGIYAELSALQLTADPVVPAAAE